MSAYCSILTPLTKRIRSYYICFGIGFQGVPWLYPTEINSLSMRTKGAALGTATNWAFNYMGKSFPQILCHRCVLNAITQSSKLPQSAFKHCNGNSISSGLSLTPPSYPSSTFSTQKPQIVRSKTLIDSSERTKISSSSRTKMPSPLSVLFVILSASRPRLGVIVQLSDRILRPTSIGLPL